MNFYLIEGSMPLLIARPCFEEWGVICDFRDKNIMYKDEGNVWHDVAQNEKGHLILDLLGGLPPRQRREEVHEAAECRRDGGR